MPGCDAGSARRAPAARRSRRRGLAARRARLRAASDACRIARRAGATLPQPLHSSRPRTHRPTGSRQKPARRYSSSARSLSSWVLTYARSRAVASQPAQPVGEQRAAEPAVLRSRARPRAVARNRRPRPGRTARTRRRRPSRGATRMCARGVARAASRSASASKRQNSSNAAASTASEPSRSTRVPRRVRPLAGGRSREVVGEQVQAAAYREADVDEREARARRRARWSRLLDIPPRAVVRAGADRAATACRSRGKRATRCRPGRATPRPGRRHHEIGTTAPCAPSPAHERSDGGGGPGLGACRVVSLARAVGRTDAQFEAHDAGRSHPERPARLRAVLDGSRTLGAADGDARRSRAARRDAGPSSNGCTRRVPRSPRAVLRRGRRPPRRRHRRVAGVVGRGAARRGRGSGGRRRARPRRRRRRVLRGAPARPPRGRRPRDGVLPAEQRRGHGRRAARSGRAGR